MQRDNGGYNDRARQPLGYGQQERRRGPAAPWPGYNEGSGVRRQPRQQGRRDYPVRGDRPRNGGHSRFLAVVVLVAAALVIVVTGLAVGSSDSSQGSESIPFELLPLPTNVVTSTTQ